MPLGSHYLAALAGHVWFECRLTWLRDFTRAWWQPSFACDALSGLIRSASFARRARALVPLRADWLRQQSVCGAGCREEERSRCGSQRYRIIPARSSRSYRPTVRGSLFFLHQHSPNSRGTVQRGRRCAGGMLVKARVHCPTRKPPLTGKVGHGMSNLNENT